MLSTQEEGKAKGREKKHGKMSRESSKNEVSPGATLTKRKDNCGSKSNKINQDSKFETR